VRNALTALEAEEEGLIDAEDSKGLTSAQATAVVSEAKAIEKSYIDAGEVTGSEEAAKEMKQEGKKIARKIAKKGMKRLREENSVSENGKKKREIGLRGVVANMQSERKESIKPLPTIKRFVLSLTGQLRKMLTKDDSRWLKLKEVAKYASDLDQEDKDNLTVALGDMIERCNVLIDVIEGNSKKLKS